MLVLHEGLLGARAARNGSVDGVGELRILRKHDMAAHDLGLGLADALLHVLGHSGGLIAEHVERGLVASLLGLDVLNIMRREGQVRIDRDGHGTDTDALRRVDSLVHRHGIFLSNCTGPHGRPPAKKRGHRHPAMPAPEIQQVDGAVNV